jgi:hypothetical protein
MIEVVDPGKADAYRQCRKLFLTMQQLVLGLDGNIIYLTYFIHEDGEKYCGRSSIGICIQQIPFRYDPGRTKKLFTNVS